MARGAIGRQLHWGVALVGTLFVLPWLVRTVPNPENIQVNQVFFPPVMLWASPLLILGLRALWERLASREGRQAAAILAGLVLVARVGFGILGGGASGNLAADRMARNMLLNLPRGAVLYSEGDTNTFSLAYLKTVLGLRPDVEVFDRTGGLFEDIYHILDGQYAKQGAPGELVRVEMAREALEADRPRFYSESENAPGRLLAVNGLLFRVSTPAAPLTAPRGLWPRFRVPRVEEGADYLSRETAARFYIFRAANSLRAGMPRGWALEDFRQAARLGHDNHRLINNIGLEYLKAGWKDMAETTFQQVVAIDPTYVLGWYNLAVLAKEMGQPVLVEKYYRRCLELAPTYSPARDGLAVVLYRTGRLQEAVLQWEKLLKTDASYAPAFRNLGMAVYEMDPRQARPLLQEYLRLAPNAPDREGIEKFMEGTR